MAFKGGVLILLLSVIVVTLSALTVKDDQGREFEQREIVVPTGLSPEDLNTEIQKAVRALYPDFKDDEKLVVKELASFDELNAKKQ